MISEGARCFPGEVISQDVREQVLTVHSRLDKLIGSLANVGREAGFNLDVDHTTAEETEFLESLWTSFLEVKETRE